jgi:hypothetical protein
VLDGVSQSLTPQCTPVLSAREYERHATECGCLYFSKRLDNGNAHSKENPSLVVGAPGDGGNSAGSGTSALCQSHFVSEAMFNLVRVGDSHFLNRTLALRALSSGADTTLSTAKCRFLWISHLAMLSKSSSPESGRSRCRSAKLGEAHPLQHLFVDGQVGDDSRKRAFYSSG